MNRIVTRPGRSVTRREFFKLSGAALTACIGQNILGFSPASINCACKPKENDKPSSSGITTSVIYQEAPELAEQVAINLLPPVEQRLPLNPCVIPVLHSIGKYDSVMHRAHKGITDRWGPTKMIDHYLLWFDHQLNLVPRLCESWEINGDSSEFTFHLREGTRWSDGVEFTTDDVYWWFHNEILDSRITPIVPYQWQVNGQTMSLVVVDKYSFKIIFIQPNVLFPYNVTRNNCFSPNHYMKQYHIDFCQDPIALEAAAVAAGYSNWSEYYRDDRNTQYLNPGRPTLSPWISKNKITENIYLYERNPYYYCIDPANNQLPYVNSVSHRLFSLDSEFANMVVQGEIDFQARHTTFSDYDLYMLNENAGGYQVVLGVSSSHNAIQLNMTAQDIRLRGFFQNRNVRIALSHAVDRSAINNSIFNGLGIPRQYSPIHTSPQYYEPLANAFINFDIAEANRLLDLTEYNIKDAQGFRLWNDGSNERISFNIVGFAELGSADGLTAQRVVQDYATVGIQAFYQYVDRGQFTAMFEANQIEAAWNGGDRTVLPLIDPSIFLGRQLDRPWCTAWTLWWLDRTNPIGEPPPDYHWIYTIWNIWDQIINEHDSDQRNILFEQILDIWATELPMIGYLGEIPKIVIMKNGLQNYDEGYPYDDPTGDENLLNPETYYWNTSFTPSMTINYESGCVGSFFTITGVGFPAKSTAVIKINDYVIDTLLTDSEGSVEFVLDTTQATTGTYEVIVSVNPTASTGFQLSNNQPLRPLESSAPVIAIPQGIAIIKNYLPLIKR